MPANRSRTERWQDCLRQVHERDGALELAMPSGAGAAFAGGTNLIWRVRIVAIQGNEIHVEQPSAMGQAIALGAGMELVAVMSIGQNRWMFHTRSLGAGPGGRSGPVLRLEMPQGVERCQRRGFYRMSTAEIALPGVEVWPLLDPSTVALAEVANRARIQELLASDITGRAAEPAGEEPPVLPEVGPKFSARLVNLGGGGAGLVVDQKEANSLDRARHFWLRIDLRPNIPAPIAMTARLAHTRLDSGMNVHAGMAFEFAFHPGHRQFVVDQVTRYVSLLQRQRRDGEPARKVA